MEPAVAPPSPEGIQHDSDALMEATDIREFVGATIEQVQNKIVILEKLGRFKKVLDTIKTIGEALSDVSSTARGPCIACSLCVPRFIQQLV